MKTWFNKALISPVENMPSNYGKIEAQKAINELFENLNDGTIYNPEFIGEMNETEKEKSISIFKYGDLFDDD